MSLQANSVSVTSVIFIVVPPRLPRRTIPRSARSGTTGASSDGRARGIAAGPAPFIDYMRIFVYKVPVASRTRPGVGPPALQGRLLQGPRPSHPDPAPGGAAR